MGCWNGTCGLSNLPIMEHDPVVAMVIQKSEIADYAPSYPWKMWSPASLLVRSTYNDHGGIVLTDIVLGGLEFSRPQSGLRMEKVAFPTPDGEEPRFGYAMVKCQPFETGSLTDDGNQDHDLFRQRDGSGFALWMAHADLFDDLTKSVKKKEYGEPTRSMRETAAHEASLYMAQDAARRAEPDPMKRFSMMDRPWGGSEMNGAAMQALRQYFQESINNPSEEDDWAMSIHWQQLASLYYLMDETRMALYPTSGSGSQDGHLAPYRARQAALNRQIKRSQERWDQY